MIVAAVIVAGCGSQAGSPDAAAPDAAGLPDAGAPDAALPAGLACLGGAPNAAATDPVVIGGKVFAVDHYEVAPVVGVNVVLRRSGDDGVIASAKTAADGGFAISAASGGVALDAYLFVDDGVHRPTYAYAGAPLDGAQDALLIVADDGELGRWYADAGAGAWDASSRTVVAAVTDCQPKSLEGATVAAMPAAAKLVYYDAGAKRWDAGLAASTNGFALLTGAAEGETIVAHDGAFAFPPHAYPTHAGAITLVVVPPTR
jgi:hypothetical protein